LHKAALDPVQRAFVAELAPKEYIASTLGSFQMIIGIVAFPASLVAGFLWDTLGSTAPFIFSLLLTSVAACMLLFVKTGQSR
jgi:MFS family permease